MTGKPSLDLIENVRLLPEGFRHMTLNLGRRLVLNRPALFRVLPKLQRHGKGRVERVVWVAYRRELWSQNRQEHGRLCSAVDMDGAEKGVRTERSAHCTNAARLTVTPRHPRSASQSSGRVGDDRLSRAALSDD
jgi:hypothetical protein